jgi:hypothetical protein
MSSPYSRETTGLGYHRMLSLCWLHGCAGENAGLVDFVAWYRIHKVGHVILP